MLEPPIDDFSTQQARAQERRRRKLRQRLQQQWARLHDELDDESAGNIEAISDEEWQAALDAEEGGEL